MADQEFYRMKEELRALALEVRDGAVADALLRGCCASPSPLVRIACQKNYGHDGPHEGGGYKWGEP